MSLLESIYLAGGHISVNKQIEDPALNHQFEGTKLISIRARVARVTEGAFAKS